MNPCVGGVLGFRAFCRILPPNYVHCAVHYCCTVKLIMKQFSQNFCSTETSLDYFLLGMMFCIRCNLTGKKLRKMNEY